MRIGQMVLVAMLIGAVPASAAAREPKGGPKKVLVRTATREGSAHRAAQARKALASVFAWARHLDTRPDTARPVRKR